MKRPILAAAAAAAALVGACASTPSGPSADVIAAAAGQAAPDAADFVRMAGASDLYEIQSSQILLSGSQDEALRRFATMMIEHHTRTTATLTAAAQQAGLAPRPPALDSAKAQMIRDLQTADGAARDQLYRRQQIMAHREALTMHSLYAQQGDTPQLKRAAASAVPIVAQHFNTLAAMPGGESGSHPGH